MFWLNTRHVRNSSSLLRRTGRCASNGSATLGVRVVVRNTARQHRLRESRKGENEKPMVLTACPAVDALPRPHASGSNPTMPPRTSPYRCGGPRRDRWPKHPRPFRIKASAWARRSSARRGSLTTGIAAKSAEMSSSAPSAPSTVSMVPPSRTGQPNSSVIPRASSSASGRCWSCSSMRLGHGALIGDPTHWTVGRRPGL